MKLVRQKGDKFVIWDGILGVFEIQDGVVGIFVTKWFVTNQDCHFIFDWNLGKLLKLKGIKYSGKFEKLPKISKYLFMEENHFSTLRTAPVNLEGPSYSSTLFYQHYFKPHAPVVKVYSFIQNACLYIKLCGQHCVAFSLLLYNIYSPNLFLPIF